MPWLAGSLRAAIAGPLGTRGSMTVLLGPPLRSGAGGVCISQRTRCLASAAGWSQRPSAEGATSGLETLARATPPLWPFAPPVIVATSHAPRARVWASQGPLQSNDTSSSTPVSILDVRLSCMDTPTNLATSFVFPSPGPLHSRLKTGGRSLRAVEPGFVAGRSVDKEDVGLRQGTVVFDEEIIAADLDVCGLACSLADRRVDMDRGAGPGRSRTFSTGSRLLRGRHKEEDLLRRYEDWPHDGPATVTHMLSHMLMFGGDPVQWPEWRSRGKGGQNGEQVMREPRVRMNISWCGGTSDQLNLASLVRNETAARHIQSIGGACSAGGSTWPRWGNSKLLSGYKSPDDLVLPLLRSGAAKKGREEVELHSARSRMLELRTVPSYEAAGAVADGALPAPGGRARGRKGDKGRGRGLQPPGEA